MISTSGIDVADALASEGTSIVLVVPREDGGETRMRVKIRYSLDSLRALEREFGSLQGLQDAFGGIMRDLSSGATGSDRGVFDALTTFLAAGMRHIRYTDPDTGERFRLGHDVERVGEMLEVGKLQEYIKAFSAAFAQAVGPTVRPGTAAAQGAPSGPPSPGPGESGGTSPSTSLTSAPTSSGS